MARTRLLIFFLPLLLALPFLNRAYFVDDNYFVEIATWLKDNPELPYHFRADDAGIQNRGWEENGFVRMVNPLAHHYYLALLIKLGGAKEWFLRLGCVLLSCFSALFIFELARRWTERPLLSTLLVLFTPTFWLTSYSLLIDSTLAFFFLGGLFFFIRATEKDNLPFYILSGIFMGLAILTKYPGLFILPLTGTWVVLRWKKLTTRIRVVTPWFIAGACLLAYSLFTKQLYGQPHILAASGRMLHVFGWPKILSFFVFLSGSLMVPLLIWGVIDLRRKLGLGLGVFILTIFFSSKLGGFSKIQSFLLSLWLVTSFLCVYEFLKNRARWIFPRDLFLFLWVLGFIGMMLLVMDWVAVRYYAIVAPAFVFLVVRLAEMRWGALSHRILSIFAIGLLIISFLLGVVDYKQAEPSRRVIGQLKQDGFYGGDRHFFLGDSFTMSYLRGEGWVPCFPDTTFQVGDRILAKEVTMPLIWFLKKPVVIRELAQYEYPSSLPLKVMDYHGSAGFYASVWGALPYSFSSGPWERFRLFEVVALKVS